MFQNFQVQFLEIFRQDSLQLIKIPGDFLQQTWP